MGSDVRHTRAIGDSGDMGVSDGDGLNVRDSVNTVRQACNNVQVSCSLTVKLLVLLMITAPCLGHLEEDFDWTEQECPDVTDIQYKVEVPWGVPGRAFLTLPPGLRVAPSLLPGAGLGVISDTFVPRYTWLGDYDGEIMAISDGEHISWYAWSIHRQENAVAYIDGHEVSLSSYHRFINMPNYDRDQNVVALECYGRIYYLTCQDIFPGQELYVFYGTNYSKHLNIDLNDYYDVPAELLSEGLDLNNKTHRVYVEEAGWELHQLKQPPHNMHLDFLKTQPHLPISN